MGPNNLCRVVVAGLVHRLRHDSRAEEFLVMQRPHNAAFYPGIWVLPGGGVDAADFAAENDGTAVLYAALRRELAEECGPDLLTFGAPRLLCERAFMRPDGTPVVVLTYMLAWFSGAPTPTDEAIDFAWVTSDEAQQFDLIGTTLDELRLADARV